MCIRDYLFHCGKITDNHKTKALLIVIIALLLQSCATILGGGKDVTRVKQGFPAAAEVYYNGNLVGSAPCNVKVDKSCKDATIEIRSAGYESQVVKMSRKISVGFTVLDICCGLLPLAIDFATGNIYKPGPNAIEYNLQKKE